VIQLKRTLREVVAYLSALLLDDQISQRHLIEPSEIKFIQQAMYARLIRPKPRRSEIITVIVFAAIRSWERQDPTAESIARFDQPEIEPRHRQTMGKTQAAQSAADDQYVRLHQKASSGRISAAPKPGPAPATTASPRDSVADMTQVPGLDPNARAGSARNCVQSVPWRKPQPRVLREALAAFVESTVENEDFHPARRVNPDTRGWIPDFYSHVLASVRVE
jgi:hypothetical protein